MTDGVPNSSEPEALTGSSLQLCPVCDESSPDGAIMCWACYHPLPGENGEGVELHRRMQERRLAARQARRHQVFDSLPLLGAALLVALGYARKSRVPLAGLGLMALAANRARSSVHDFKIEFMGRTLTGGAQVTVEEAPTKRITDTILLYAVRDGASKIRLRAGTGIVVHYLIGDEWVEQMKIPGYIWKDLRAHLIGQSDNWTRPVPFEMDGQRFEFAGEFKRERELPLEVVTLSLLD